MKIFLILSLIEASVFLTYAYVGVEDLDTKDGYCKTPHVRLAVGDVSYNDEKCEKLSCTAGRLRVTGCAPMHTSRPGCRLVPGEGHFPMCCPHIEECVERRRM